MTDKTEKAAPNPSVGADAEQSFPIHNNSIIPDNPENSNDFEEKFAEWQKEMQRSMDPSYLKTVTMSTLYETAFETQAPLIEGLLNRGTYLFAGSPKVGKSFLMAQLAYHISTGTPLWNYKVRKSTVLYFALEDDYARLQQRLYQMFGENETGNLYLATSCRKLGDGLEEQIQGFLSEHPDTGLIILDTLKRVRESERSDYSYGSDYDTVVKLKNLADSYRITMILVHHTRKQTAEDKFDMISGTNGLLGAADGAFVLCKKSRTDLTAILDITSRDQQDQRLTLSRDTQRLVWNLENVETELWETPKEPLLEKVAEKLSEIGGEWTGTPTELADLLDVNLKANVLTLKLNVNIVRLYSDYHIRYTHIRTHNGRKITLCFDNL